MSMLSSPISELKSPIIMIFSYFMHRRPLSQFCKRLICPHEKTYSMPAVSSLPPNIVMQSLAAFVHESFFSSWCPSSRYWVLPCWINVQIALDSFEGTWRNTRDHFLLVLLLQSPILHASLPPPWKSFWPRIVWAVAACDIDVVHKGPRPTLLGVEHDVCLSCSQVEKGKGNNFWREQQFPWQKLSLSPR